MNNLINAGFSRLFKSLSFKIYLAFTAGYTLLNTLTHYQNIKMYLDIVSDTDRNLSIDAIAFDSSIGITISSAFFIAIFIGREYTDGALRNKLIVGRSRGSIYLSNLVVCICANLMAAAVALTLTFALGVPLLGTNLGTLECASCILCEIFALTSVTAVYLIIVMMIPSRAVELLVSVIAAFAMLSFSSYISDRLMEPEYYGGYQAVVADEGGEVTWEYIEEGKNPYYLEGDMRKVFEFIDSFLPSSQLYHLCNHGAPEFPQAVIYDIIVILAAAEGGVLLFSKKDVK